MAARSPKSFLINEKASLKEQIDRLYRLLREDIIQNSNDIEDHEDRITELEP